MKKIALVVGHRRTAPGAYGDAGIPEWIFWNDAVEDIINKASKYSVELKVFHRKETGSGYTQRMKKLHKEIDAWGADISISLHFNAASSRLANGHEVLYCASSSRGHKYAKMMNDKFNKYLDNKDRGIKPKTRKDRGGGFLCRGKSACILIEPFFASHQHEYIHGGRKREDLTQAIAEFIRDASKD